MTLRHHQGTLPTYQLMDESQCEGSMGLGGTQPAGTDSYADHEITCPSIAAGEVILTFQLTGTAEGILIVEDVQLDP